MADIVNCAAVIPLQRSTRRIAEMSKKKLKNRKEEIKRQIKENNIEINKGMLFLPDDINQFKGKWILYIKKGKLVRLDKNKENKKE